MADYEFPWREILAMLHRRRRLILQVFVAGVVTVFLGVWSQGPRYRATATIMVTSDRAKVAVSPDANTRPTIDRVTDLDLNSEAELLKSEALIRDVLAPHYDATVMENEPTSIVKRISNLVWLPLQLPGIIYRKIHGVASPTPLDEWVESTAQGLGVTTLGRSNLIQVSYEDAKPEWAAQFVNELVAGHIERHTRLNQQSEARLFFESQRELVDQRTRQAEASLQAFYEREGITAMPAQRENIRARLTSLDSILADSERELAEGTARVKFLTSEVQTYPKSLPLESMQSPTAQMLKPKVMELELLRTELLSKYAPTSVRIQDVDKQIAEAKRMLQAERDSGAAGAANPAYQAIQTDLAQTRAHMAAVQARVEALRSQIAGYRKSMEHLDEIASEQERLEQEVKAAKEAFVTYSKKEEEARFSSALDDSSIVNINVAEPAKAPAGPERSKKIMMVMLGAVMSLMAGIALAFVRDRLDPSVKSAAEAQGVTGLPILAEVQS